MQLRGPTPWACLCCSRLRSWWVCLYSVGRRRSASFGVVTALLGFLVMLWAFSRPRVMRAVPARGHVVPVKRSAARLSRMVGGSTEVPLGEHRLVLEDGFLTWEWVDGESTSRFPVRRITTLVESLDLLVFVAGRGCVATLPLSVFASDEEREAFERAVVG